MGPIGADTELRDPDFAEERVRRELLIGALADYARCFGEVVATAPDGSPGGAA